MDLQEFNKVYGNDFMGGATVFKKSSFPYFR